MPVLDRYLRRANPERAPRAMGSVPRLGIGDRHTTAVWPAAFRAMDRGGFAANAIQNSLRELTLLDDLKRGLPARQNHLFGFGSIAEGHTGSTFEGLLHAGVIAALKAPTHPRYGADADHIQVKRGPGGLDRAREVVDAARHYTFFTLDVSDILDYGALAVAGDAEARALLSATLAGTALLVGKIWDAIIDPAIGFLSDRTKSRMGRRRPWMLGGAISVVFFMILMYTNPHIQSQGGLFVWVIVVYCLLVTSYSVINIPYGALTPELTWGYDEQTSLNAWRMSFAVIGTRGRSFLSWRA